MSTKEKQTTGAPIAAAPLPVQRRRGKLFRWLAWVVVILGVFATVAVIALARDDGAGTTADLAAPALAEIIPADNPEVFGWAAQVPFVHTAVPVSLDTLSRSGNPEVFGWAAQVPFVHIAVPVSLDTLSRSGNPEVFAAAARLALAKTPSLGEIDPHESPEVFGGLWMMRFYPVP